MPLYTTEGGIQRELTPQEEAEFLSRQQNFEQTIKPVLDRKRAFIEAKRAALSFDKEEVDILLAGYLEVKLVRLAVLLGQTPGSIDTPVIDSFNAVFPGQTKLQIAQTIEARAQGYLTTAATALANKIKNGG